MHNKFVICCECNAIAHDKCAEKLFNFDQICDTWHCFKCHLNQIKRYNPFNNLYRDSHLPDDSDAIVEIESISKILNSCKNYCYTDLEKISDDIKLNFSLLFNNIDGAASNFETFITQIEQYNFPVIGISETNLDEEHGALYNIPGYNSVFQSKIDGKAKGSGLGLYLRDNLIYTHCIELSQCTKNLETLYTSLSQKMVTGLSRHIW